MNKTFVFGHKSPDTDSVTASISFSYLKNKLGENTVPMVLGEINKETKYVLKYFGVAQPTFLNDVKLQIKDIRYKKGIYLNDKESIFTAYNYMMENNVSTIPIVDDKNKMFGIVSMKDIARENMCDEGSKLHTSFDNILEVLKGKKVLKFDEEIKGNINVALLRSTTFIQNTKLDNNDILIVGDRHSIIEYAINSNVKLIIVTKDGEIKPSHLELAREKKINIIETKLDTFKVVRLINLCNYVKTITLTKNVFCFDENDTVNNFVDFANKTKFTNYPIINKENECLGLLRLADLADKNKKKVILVDHNSKEQTVDGIDEAEILEIVDHHNIGSIGTQNPITFRNMPVGSSNTIIYEMYKENKVEIPKDIAGLMLSGIISDTLLLMSPTTTDYDRTAVKDLAKIADVNYSSYGLEMFKAGSSLEGMSKTDVLYNDFKKFNANDRKFGIGQIFTMDIDEIKKEIDEYVKLIDEICKNEEYAAICLFITDIINNGSYMIYNTNSKDIVSSAFNIKEVEECTYLPGVVSRKKQILPNLLAELEK